MSVTGKQLACQIQSKKASETFLSDYGFGGQLAIQAILAATHPNYAKHYNQTQDYDLAEESKTHSRMFFEDLKILPPDFAEGIIKKWQSIPEDVMVIVTGKTKKQWNHLIATEIEMDDENKFWIYYLEYSRNIKQELTEVDLKVRFITLDMFASQQLE